MYLANEQLTLVRHIETPTEDKYVSIATQGSWKHEAGNDMSRQGQAPVSSVTVRIPEENLPFTLPVAGDYMVRGVVSVGSLSDLKGKEYFRVAAVRDNRRGVNLRHLAVLSE